jgi:hypothetical protein
MDDPKTYKDDLAIHFESPRNLYSNIATVYRGWFIAPATTRYRFYTVCDDHCAMRMAHHPD